MIDPLFWVAGAGFVGLLSVVAILIFRRGGQGETKGSCLGLLLIGLFAIAALGIVVRVTQNARWKARAGVVEVRAPDGVRIHAGGFAVIPTPARLELSEKVFATSEIPEEILAELHPGAKIILVEPVGLTVNETPFGHWVVLVTRAILERSDGTLDPLVLVLRKVEEHPEQGQRVIEVRVRGGGTADGTTLGFPVVRSNGVEYPPNTDWERTLRIDDPPQVFLELDAAELPDEIRRSHPEARLVDLLAR